MRTHPPPLNPALPQPARYFPVRAGAYRMTAGLSAFGTDFGNAAGDGFYFQLDCDAERYRRDKTMVRPQRQRVVADDDALLTCHAAVLGWMAATLRREHPGLLTESRPTYESIARVVQEDFVVVRQRPGGGDEAIAVFVCFPSGWRPESIAGKGFKEIHEPVPDFAERDAAVESMVATMIERGPYVRFVWTISADDHLDHHPEDGRRSPWSAGGAGWFRVERQVTVPFAQHAAALFLIRTYLYPFASLAGKQRQTLARSLKLMPEAIAAYKGLSLEARRIACQLLQ